MEEREIRHRFEQIDSRLADGNTRFALIELENKQMKEETRRVAAASEKTAETCQTTRNIISAWTAEQEGESKANKRFLTVVIIGAPILTTIVWEAAKHFLGWHA